MQACNGSTGTPAAEAAPTPLQVVEAILSSLENADAPPSAAVSRFVEDTEGLRIFKKVRELHVSLVAERAERGLVRAPPSLARAALMSACDRFCSDSEAEVKSLRKRHSEDMANREAVVRAQLQQEVDAKEVAIRAQVLQEASEREASALTTATAELRGMLQREEAKNKDLVARLAQASKEQERFSQVVADVKRAFGLLSDPADQPRGTPNKRPRSGEKAHQDQPQSSSPQRRKQAQGDAQAQASDKPAA